ncbi:holocytochrome c synthase [Savitreella phatthalungensis]
MGFFWADRRPAQALQVEQGTVSKCPVDHTKLRNAPAAQPQSEGRCPVDHGKLNPRNNMPSALSQQRISEQQKVALSTTREMSTIPKSRLADEDEEGDGVRWEYPSAQQLYNAMVRKGYEQSGEHVESMLSVHNFLNEEAWSEILEWEKYAVPKASADIQPSLMKFTGVPERLSPKAWIYSRLQGGHEPFDRHDWYVDRDGSGKLFRYVIDYYEAPNDEEGNPVFSLDIRPGIDSPASLYQRVSRWTSETWTKAKGVPTKDD